MQTNDKFIISYNSCIIFSSLFLVNYHLNRTESENAIFTFLGGMKLIQLHNLLHIWKYQTAGTQITAEGI